jgi:hypothetical protein
MLPAADTPHDKIDAMHRWTMGTPQDNLCTDKLADFIQEVSTRSFPIPGGNNHVAHVLEAEAVAAVQQYLIDTPLLSGYVDATDGIPGLVDAAHLRGEPLVLRICKSQINPW